MKILIIGKGKMGTLLKEFFEKEYQVFNIDTLSLPTMKNVFDYIIDFSHPASLKKYKNFVTDKTKIIIGTTNFSSEDKDYILFLSKMNPIVIDSNFSSGIDFIKRLLYVVNETKYDVTINETHHKNKLDTPSGTTKDFLSILNKKTPTVNSYRIDGENGIHEIVLSNEYETLKFEHKVLSKEVFCLGVKKSLLFLKDKENGLFTFKDVIDCGY